MAENENTERWNVYLPEKNVTVNVPKVWDYSTIMSEYNKKEKEQQEQTKQNLSIFQKQRFTNPLQQESPYSYYSSLIYRQKEKQLGEETPFLETAGKSFVNQLYDLSIGAVIRGEGIARDEAEYVKGTFKSRKLSPKEREKFLKDVNKIGREALDKYSSIADKYRPFTIREGESETAQGIGSVFSSFGLMGLAGAYGYLGKGMKITEALKRGFPVATLFGFSSGEDMYYRVREGGGSVGEATKRASKAFTGEVIWEEASLATLMKGVRANFFKNYPQLGFLVTAGGTGFVQESGQEYKDIAIAGEYDQRTQKQKINGIVEAGLLGALGEIFGGYVSSSFNRDLRLKIKNELVANNVSPKTAEFISWEVTENPKGLSNAFLETMKQRVKVFTDDEIAKGQKAVEEALEQGGDFADIYLEQKDAYKERMLKAGKSEREAEEESTFWATRDSSLWQALKDVNADISKEDFLKERTQRIENLPVDVKVNRQGNITPESEALLDEARERAAIMEENGATPEEIQAVLEDMGVEGGKLFSDVDKEWEARFGDYSVEDVKAYQISNDFEKKTYQDKIDSGMSEKQAIIETMDESIKRDSSKMNTESPLFSRVFVKGKEVEAFDDIRTAEGRPVNYSNEGNYYDTGINRAARLGRDETAVVRMSPQQFLELTPKGMGSRDVSNLETAINEGKEIPMPFLEVEILDKDNKILKVFGHEGRHRSLAMSNLGVNDGYVILTGRDLYRNKELLKDLSEWKILGQKETDATKAVPLSKNMFPSEELFSRDSGFDYAKGSYYNKVASLYKGQSPDTLVHELSHDFFKSYFKLTEKYGLQDRNKDIYDMLGKKSSKEFGTKEWETLTDEFMKYIKTSESPNLASRNMFERAKDWLIKTFYTMNQDEKPSPEVKEFFDNLISSDLRDMDLTDLQMTPRSLKEIFKSIKEGNEIGLKGVKRKDLLAIQKAMLTSTNRRGKTLAEEMRRDNMRIKAGSDLAKQFGYDPKKKLSDQPIFGTEGIDSMDSLDEYLVEKGMLEPNHAETYEQSSDRESQIESIIDQAESIYTPEQQKIADRKYAIEQNALKAQNLANDIIKDNDLGIKTLEDFNKYLDDAIRMAKSVDAVLVNKNALDFLFEGYENANKMVSKLEKDLKNAQDVIGVRQQLTDYVRRLPLNAQHRLSLLDKVKQVQKGDDFTEVLGKINDSFRKDWEQETKTLLRNNIDLIIKSTKPKDRKHQKYNYEYNKLFEEFRKINGMRKKDAPDALMDFMQKKLSEDSEFTEADRVKNLLLSYKANGMKSSIDLMKQLESSLYELRNAAIEDRISALEAKAKKKQAQIKSMVNHVENTKKVGIINATVLKATNLYSNEAELFGKDWADAHEMETVELAQNIEVKKRIEEQIRIGKEIYGVKGDYDYAKLMNEKSQKKFTLYGINGAAEGFSEQISLAQIMDIYETIKNKRSREIYDWLYEQHDEEGNTLTHNIQDLLDNLTEQDKRFADALQAKIQSWREAENKVYVNLYGIDMPEIDNYYPRSSKKKEKELMDIKQFANIDMIPSFFKDRSNFPFAFPENAWVKFQQRANDSVYMTNTFEKFKDQYDLIHNQRVSNAIVTKYDGQRYTSLTTSLNDLSLNGSHETFDEAEKLIGQGIGNWVVSQIAINPAVFTKQLVSLTNYAENMNVGDFIKYEAEFLMNPVKAINFMRDFDKEFLDYRFSNGMQNEVLAKIMGDAEKSLKKYGYAYQKYLDLITLPVRYGDVGAIYIGGYARVKQLLESGKTLEEARNIFRFETQRSQQSGLKASLSEFQKNRYARILTAFKNTQLQYMRKMQDSYIQWRRGEISTEQAAKIWANYMFIQATAYQILTNIFGFLRDDDDDKEMDWFKDVGMQIMTAPIAGIPLLGEMAQDVIRDKHYDLGMAGLGDLNKFLAQIHSIKKKYYEDDLDAKTVAKGVATIFQFIKPLPNNIIKPILND